MPPVDKVHLRTNTARRVRAARAWADLSQPALAKLLDMSLASLRRIEQQARDVSTAELLHIGEVCDVPRRFMLYGWAETGKSTAQTQAVALEGIIADMTKRIEKHERLHTLIQEQLSAMDPEAAGLFTDMDDASNTPDLTAPLEEKLQQNRVKKNAR